MARKTRRVQPAAGPMARRQLYESAMEYVSKAQWCVIPVSGKSARCPWSTLTQLPTPEVLDAWFRQGGVTGVAVVLGEVSGGLWTRDLDTPDAYHAWKAAYPDWAAQLPTVRTHRGFHVHAYHALPVKSITFPDGELHGVGHYSVVPPSQHEKGSTYVWVHGGPDERITVSPEDTGLAEVWSAPDGATPSEPTLDVIQRVQPVQHRTILFNLYVQPFFKKSRLREVTRDVAATFIKSLFDAGLAYSSVKFWALPSVKACFGAALDRGLIDKHPFHKVKVPRHPKTGEATYALDEVKTYTAGEVEALLAAARTRRGFRERSTGIILLGVRCGLREGEIAGLRNEDVDFDKHRIRICRNFTNGEMTTIKTASTMGVEVQYVHMTPEVESAMRAPILWTRKLMLRHGKAAEWLWGAKPLYAQPVRVMWLYIIRRAKVRRLKFHALRATFATHLVAQGMKPKELQAAMRHANFATTMQYYIGLDEASMVEVWDRLDRPAAAAGKDAHRPHTATIARFLARS